MPVPVDILGDKPKAPPTVVDLPVDCTPEDVLLSVLNRQLPLGRASKYLGGIRLDYLKYCQSGKGKLSSMTGQDLVNLNAFLQSNSTLDWLRRLRSLYFWPCAKPLFLREIYRFTSIATSKRLTICGNNSIGSQKSCDQQSPATFWIAFERMHQIQFDNEPMVDEQKWDASFQRYLFEKRMDCEQVQRVTGRFRCVHSFV